jgi:GT2 family glycosyltransferase
MPSCDALERTRTALDALRRNAEPGFPLEIVVVDNGSRDGSREWLAQQPDVTLVANATNEGAPRARNQALRHVHGARVCFMDNDVVVTPGWLARLARHMELDPFAACVGPLADRAAHGQEVAFDAAQGSPDARADEIARANPGGFRLASLLSSFLVLVRREALEAVGGFDERFSPWGFEDDDLTLRCVLAGFHNRVALDTFVRHASYGSDADKARRHAALLDANWRRFAQKWGLAQDAPHGDYAGLAPLLERDPAQARDDARIRVPVDLGDLGEPGDRGGHTNG